MTRVLLGGIRQQFRDNQITAYGTDKPLAFGQVLFLDAYTSTPKAIWSGPESDPTSFQLANPYTLDGTGMGPEDGFWLGDGTYSLQVYRRTNPGQTNPMYTEIWSENPIVGGSVSGLGSQVNTIIVNSIADLRTVDYSVYKAVIVLGYYTAGDAAGVRTYTWAASAVIPDDGGAYVHASSQPATGTWVCDNLTGDLSCSIWGVLPGAPGTIDVQIGRAFNYCYNHAHALVIEGTGLLLNSSLTLGGQGVIKVKEGAYFTCLAANTSVVVTLSPDELFIEGLIGLTDPARVIQLVLNPKKELEYVYPQYWGSYPGAPDSTAGVMAMLNAKGTPRFTQGQWNLTSAPPGNFINLVFPMVKVDDGATVVLGGHVIVEVVKYEGPKSTGIWWSGALNQWSFNYLRAIHCFSVDGQTSQAELVNALEVLTTNNNQDAGVHSHKSGKIIWGDGRNWVVADLALGYPNNLTNTTDGQVSFVHTGYHYIGEWDSNCLYPPLTCNDSANGFLVINPDASLYGTQPGDFINNNSMGVDAWGLVISSATYIYNTLVPGLKTSWDMRNVGYSFDHTATVAGLQCIDIYNANLTSVGGANVPVYDIGSPSFNYSSIAGASTFILGSSSAKEFSLTLNYCNLKNYTGHMTVYCDTLNSNYNMFSSCWISANTVTDSNSQFYSGSVVIDNGNNPSYFSNFLGSYFGNCHAGITNAFNFQMQSITWETDTTAEGFNLWYTSTGAPWTPTGIVICDNTFVNKSSTAWIPDFAIQYANLSNYGHMADVKNNKHIGYWTIVATEHIYSLTIPFEYPYDDGSNVPTASGSFAIYDNKRALAFRGGSNAWVNTYDTASNPGIDIYTLPNAKQQSMGVWVEMSYGSGMGSSRGNGGWQWAGFATAPGDTVGGISSGVDFARYDATTKIADFGNWWTPYYWMSVCQPNLINFGGPNTATGYHWSINLGGVPVNLRVVSCTNDWVTNTNVRKSSLINATR